MAIDRVREVAGCESLQELPELLPGGFHTVVIASASGKNVTQEAEGSYHLRLIRSDLNITLRSVVNRPGSRI